MNRLPLPQSSAYNCLMNRLLYSIAALSLIAGCTSQPQYSAEQQRLPPCGIFPNCVNSDSGEGGQAIEPIPATAAGWLELKRWVGEQQDWSIVEQQENFLQCVAVTPLMRFRDDIQLLFQPDSGLIQARSSSRLGISDMGANRKRVEMLRQQMQALQ